MHKLLYFALINLQSCNRKCNGTVGCNRTPVIGHLHEPIYFRSSPLNPPIITLITITIRSCSIGINHFRLVRLVEFFCVLLAKNRLRLVWLLNFFNPHQTGLKRLKKHWYRPLLFSQALIAATCGIDCVISSITARATLLANKKDEKHV